MANHAFQAQGRKRRGGLRVALMLVVCFVIGAGAALLVRQTGGLDIARLSSLVESVTPDRMRPDRMTTSAYAPPARPDFAATTMPRAMPVCGSGRRVNCVVDGDTLWLDGEKIRLVNIDAPEVKARCRAESVRAAEATHELARLVDRHPLRIAREGADRYGRTLAAISTAEGDVGDILVARDLAMPWGGRREAAETWCGF